MVLVRASVWAALLGRNCLLVMRQDVD